MQLRRELVDKPGTVVHRVQVERELADKPGTVAHRVKLQRELVDKPRIYVHRVQLQWGLAEKPGMVVHRVEVEQQPVDLELNKYIGNNLDNLDMQQQQIIVLHPVLGIE